MNHHFGTPPHPHPQVTPTARPDATGAFPPTPAPPRRAFAPDLARGVMLGLIGIANVSAYLWGRFDADSTSGHPAGDTALDTVLSVLTILFVDGSIYPLFAFLFGYGIVQFSRHRTLVCFVNFFPAKRARENQPLQHRIRPCRRPPVNQKGGLSGS